MSITYRITSSRSPLSNTIGELDEANLLELARQFKTAELRAGRVRKTMLIRRCGITHQINLENICVLNHTVTVGDIKETIQASQQLTISDLRLQKMYEKYVGKMVEVQTTSGNKHNTKLLKVCLFNSCLFFSM